MVKQLYAAMAATALLTGACARPAAREYELRGVVVSVDAGRQEITIKHEDIPRFMPGMTMPFKVRDARLLNGRVPGDLVRATLVVEDASAHLRTLERTGSGPVPAEAAERGMDILDTGEEPPDARFVDQDGRERRLSDWRGQAVVVTFVYTRCPLPNFCPAMDRQFAAVQEMVRQDRDLDGRVRLLSVSFDPEHDRPEVLRRHAKTVGADPRIWSFVTGDAGEMTRFASRFGVSVLREGAGPGEIVHNLRTSILDPAGRLFVAHGGSEWQPADLVAELRKAIGGAAAR
jgi:protein SCO1/2